jgi:RNA polymerase sigma-32 factor
VNLLKKMKKFFEAEMPDIKDFFDGEDMVIKSGRGK